MQQVDVKHASQHLGELIDLTMRGDEVLITQEGQPVVKLIAIKRSKRQRQFGSAKGLIQIADDFDEPLPEFQEYM
jgi:prevent-host-death family protein